MLKKFIDASPGEIDEAMKIAGTAARDFSKFSLKQRAHFMRTIAQNLENAGDQLFQRPWKKRIWPKALKSEKARTFFN